MMSPPCGPCSQASSLSKPRLGDVLDVDVKVSTIVADLRQTLRLVDHQDQQRKVDLLWIVAKLLETPRSLLDASTRQSIR